ncbi:MAG: PIG-L family deacetylase [Chloroflexi bacterium]|jgi:LmbE family N-acetylglucosaminyl deacetylase|nr:PIG-L family deacetylase [Chloroflexota bacterium]
MSDLSSTEPGTVLLIAAHPDDPEFGCGATIARWVQEGWRVVYVLCTRGEQGTHDVGADLEAVKRTREAEQRAAAAVLGVAEVRFLDYPDGLLEPTLALRKDLTREIRRYRPQRLICQSPNRILDSRGLRRNHPDHMAAGAAALAAVYPTASTPHLFPELLAAGFAPWIVPEIYVTESADPDVIIDVSETLDQKIAALRCHASQVRPGFEDRVRSWARELGERHGLRAAEAFRLIRQE